MRLKISAILINRVLSEEEQTTFVREYYRSYALKGEVMPEAVLHPAGRDMFFGSVGGTTIPTHNEIPYSINYDARNIGVYERRHPLLSKLTKQFPKQDRFCRYFNSVGVYFPIPSFARV